jgi:putative membrane protein
LNTPEPGQWRRTSPLAILFFLGKLARDIAKNAWQSLAPLAAVILAAGGDMIDRLKIGGMLFLLAVVGIAALRYWFFRFQLGDDSVLIREGVIKKKQLDIKFDRIQGINTQQNIVFRYFGLVTVTFDTAGSSGDEGNLPAVPRAFADVLRERIGKTPVAADETGEEVTPEALLQLGWRDMIKIGLSDKRALLVLAVLGPVMERLGDGADEVITNYVENTAQGVFPYGAATGAVIFVTASIGLVLLMALASITAAFLRYHNFELYLAGTTLRSNGGLLTRHEVSMGLGKIQTLRIEQGVILRLFKRFRMSARQARASHKNDSNKNFMIPVVTDDEATDLRRRFLDEEGRGLIQIPTSDQFSPISAYSMRLHMVINVLIPILLASIGFGIAGDRGTLLFLAWIPISFFFTYKTWRHAGYLYTDEGFVRRSGTLGYRTVALLYRKVQRVSVTRSPLQRRKGLATLRVYMASGSVRIPYIEHELAAGLRNYILYKVESSQQAWH